MPEPTEIRNLPVEKVAENVDQLIVVGAKDIRCIKQDDGDWTIRAS